MSATLKLKEITRLLVNTPSPAHADARSRLAEFVNVMEPFDLRHVQRAVMLILAGDAEGIDPKFAIFPPVLAQLCRTLRDREITKNSTRLAAIAQIEDRSKVFHEDPVEVRRAAVAAGLARLTALHGDEETPEQVKARKEATEQHLANHDSFFLANDTDEARRARLWNNK